MEHTEFEAPFLILSFCFGNDTALCNLLENSNLDGETKTRQVTQLAQGHMGLGEIIK